MEAPPSVVIPEAAMSQLAVVKKSLHVAVKKSLHVAVKKSLHVVVKKSLHAVVKSLLAVAKPTAAIVLAAKIVDADSWRNFSLRRAAAMDASQLAVAKKSQLAAAKPTLAIQVATVAVFL